MSSSRCIQNCTNLNHILQRHYNIKGWCSLMFHGLQNLVLGILLRYTPLSMKELLELYTKQTVDLCECHCFALSDMILNLKNENLYDNYLVRPKKGIYCECPIFSVYSLLKNIVFYFWLFLTFFFSLPEEPYEQGKTIFIIDNLYYCLQVQGIGIW